ncbi:MAG: protein translocase subunit SecF [Gammaproteobacteria bacterium]|nr:MAG: protein translocase subunit SecF [Gammaproteobacteria bacterium]
MNMQTRINFMGQRKLAFFLSATLIVFSIVSLATRGLNLGIDFTGGTIIEVGFEQPADVERIRALLEQDGLGNPVVQHFGTARDVLIRIPPQKKIEQARLGDHVLKLLRDNFQGEEITLRRVEFVGPQVGEDLRDDGGLSILFALFGILVYVALRFEYRFAVGSIIALIHDVTITTGFFSVTQIQFDLTVLAALLAVIGYSLNDTIVVFDRIRENFRRLRKAGPEEIMNVSINETLSRTIVTSLTTLLVLVALFLFGGEIMRGFSLALIVGIVVGTYSSIYVASSLVLSMGISKQDLMPPQKDKVQGPQV